MHSARASRSQRQATRRAQKISIVEEPIYIPFHAISRESDMTSGAEDLHDIILQRRQCLHKTRRNDKMGVNIQMGGNIAGRCCSRRNKKEYMLQERQILFAATATSAPMSSKPTYANLTLLRLKRFGRNLGNTTVGATSREWTWRMVN